MVGKTVDLVLINPGGQRQIYQILADTFTAKEPPVWAGLLATYIRRRGFSVEIIDANAEDLSPEEVAKRVVTENPLLVGVVVYGHQPSASTQVMPAAGLICRVLKERAPELKVIMLGGHVAALPERTLREEATDFVCSGEGPYTVWKLLEVMKAGRLDYDSVPGLWYFKGDQVKATNPAPLIDFDKDIPEGVAWDLLPVDKYRAHNWHCFGFINRRQPYASTYTTLGCPFKCAFCCINAPFGGSSYRLRDPKHVAEELDILVQKYKVKNLKIADEMFVVNIKHVSEICDLIIERGYDLNIWAYARVDTVRREGLLEKMKKAGFNWLALGIESGTSKVRDSVNKSFQQDTIYHSIEKIRKAGINVVGNYILGLPEDNYDTMQATLDLAIDLCTEWANFYVCMAYPGSALYERAVKEGWPLPKDWSGYSQHSIDTFPLPTKYLSGGEVLSFRDHAFQTYFTNPKYLSYIENKFGSETVEHIKEMVKIKLVRRFAAPLSFVK